MSNSRSTTAPRRWSRFWLPAAFVVVLTAEDCGCADLFQPALESVQATLQVSPDTLAGFPGQTVRTTVRMTSTLGRDRLLTLSTREGSDLTATFAPGQLSDASPSAEMVIAIPSSTPPGDRLLLSRVAARFQGQGDASATFSSTAYVRVLTPPSITASIDPSGITVVRGGTGSATLSVTRNGNYTGDLSVQVAGLPAGVSVSGTTIGTGTRATVAFTVPLSAPVGVAVLQFTVSGAGVASQTVPFALLIADPPGFTLAAATASQTITQGTTGDGVGVSVTRQGGFGGAITLSVTGLPTGVTAAFTQPGVGSSGLMVLTAAATAAKGTYPLTLRANASGLPERTAQFSLIVAEPAGFTLSPETQSQLVTAGTTASPVRVDVTRQGGFAGSVALAVGPLPAGVTVATTAPGTGTSGSFAVTASPTAVVGRHELFIVGTASGVREQAVPFVLIVAAAPTVSLALNAPTQFTSTRGGSSSVTIGVFRTGWTGAVSLQVSGAPSGMTASMVPASTTNNFSFLELRIGDNMALGTYPLQISGTGANGTSATATVNVIVQP
jgi:hypothetical protein